MPMARDTNRQSRKFVTVMVLVVKIPSKSVCIIKSILSFNQNLRCFWSQAVPYLENEVLYIFSRLSS